MAVKPSLKDCLRCINSISFFYISISKCEVRVRLWSSALISGVRFSAGGNRFSICIVSVHSLGHIDSEQTDFKYRFIQFLLNPLLIVNVDNRSAKLVSPTTHEVSHNLPSAETEIIYLD